MPYALCPMTAERSDPKLNGSSVLLQPPTASRSVPVTTDHGLRTNRNAIIPQSEIVLHPYCLAERRLVGNEKPEFMDGKIDSVPAFQSNRLIMSELIIV